MFGFFKKLDSTPIKNKRGKTKKILIVSLRDSRKQLYTIVKRLAYMITRVHEYISCPLAPCTGT